MYGNFLRQSTKKLQDDLRQTMRTYSTEKQQLLRHLASLRHEMDELRTSGTSSPDSEYTDRSLESDNSHRHKSRRYYMAPNIAAHKLKKKKRKENGKKLSPRSARGEGKEDKKPKEGILKLPSIQEANTSISMGYKNNSEWDSGEQISLANLPPIDPPNGIAAAQALLQDSYKIPNITDPDRRDISVETSKTSLFKDREKKKVQFSEKTQINVITPCAKHENDDIDDVENRQSKNFKAEESKFSPRNSKGKNHHLPPLDGKKSLTPRETEDHKLMYISIKDPEIRTKTLSEILHAVRVRMQENEQHMKYFGMTPPRKINNTYEFLVSSSLDRHSPLPRSESQRVSRTSSILLIIFFLREINSSCIKCLRMSNTNACNTSMLNYMFPHVSSCFI